MTVEAPLKPFPLAAVRAIELAGDPQATPSEVVDVVSTDPAIAARMLTLVNSALFGLKREIVSLVEAGNHLGKTRMAELALTTSYALAHAPAKHLTFVDSEFLWRRSFTRSIVARRLFETQCVGDPGQGFMVGLLASVGHLWLHRELDGPERDELRRRVRDGAELLDAERAVLGQDHYSRSAELLEHWDLPRVLCDAIRRLAAPDAVEPEVVAFREAQWTADELMCEAGRVSDEHRWMVDAERVERRIEEGTSEALKSAARDELRAVERLF